MTRNRPAMAAIAALLIAVLLLCSLLLESPARPDHRGRIIPLEQIPRAALPGIPHKVTRPSHIFQPSSSFDELWRIAGLLKNRHGQRFGFNLQILKFAQNPPTDEPPAPWDVHDIYAARVTLALEDSGQLFEDFRFSRDSLALAGFDPGSGCMHILDWRMCEASGETPEKSILLKLPAGFGTLHINIDSPTNAPLEPDSRATMRIFLQTALTVRGRLNLPENTQSVRGVFFLERLIGHIDNTGGALIWNSFHLDLSNGMTLRLMQSRRKSGRGSAIASGILIPDNEPPISLKPPATNLSASGHWTSPHTSARYPLEWRLRIPDHHLDLNIRPLIPDQETRLLRPVWDGAVLVEGMFGGKFVDGNGQIVLQGYQTATE